MYNYDFFEQDWNYLCRTCDTELYAPTRKELWRSHWIHTHKVCLGGY